MPRVEHVCLDGSPFPVEFAASEDAGARWSIDREHAPRAMTPLADAVRRVGRPGEERAYADCGVTMPSTLQRDRPVANGFAYHLELDLTPAEWDRLADELVGLTREHGGTFGVWSNHCLPLVQDACAWIESAPSDTPFAGLACQREYAWGLTSVAGSVARVDEVGVAASCQAMFGPRSTFIAYELAQGSENETISSDQTLGRIARMGVGSPEAVTARSAFLAAHGPGAVSWSIDEPTLAERPELLDAQIALLRRHGRGDLDALVRDAARRRQDLAERIDAELTSEEERARFRARLARLASFVPVREARARWQLVATGALRRAVLRRGRDLADLDVLVDPGDVFYLTPQEYDAPTGDLRAAVDARRAEHRRWLEVTPPATVGAGDPDPDPDLPDDAGGVTLRGIPGAPGRVDGPARVIRDLADVDRLEPGDVLVTTMTSPAWTPLFAVAAAVVTDAGDALSHVAIAAREYGIACVAGTGHATVSIADGTSVRVDGTAGTVQVLI